MATIVRLPDAKTGDKRYRLQASQGRGKTAITRSFTLPADWSEKSRERECRKRLAEFEKDVAEGRALTRKQARDAHERAERESLSDPLLSSLVRVHLEGRPELSSGTVTEYDICLRLRVLPALGDLHLSEIDRRTVQAFVDGLRDKGYSHSSACAALTALRSVLHTAEREGLIASDPTVGVKVRPDSKDSRPDPARKALSPDELQAFLRAADEGPLVWRTYFHAMADCGCRRGELLAVEWKDIDFSAGTVTLRRSWNPSAREMSATKTGRVRTVPLSSGTLELFRALRKEQAEEGISPYPFCARKDRTRPSGAGVDYLCHRIAERAGVRNGDVHPHQLRHTVGSLAIQGGADIQAVASLLGHGSVATTMGVYVHELGDGAARAAAAVQRVRLNTGKEEGQAPRSMKEKETDGGLTPAGEREY